MKTIYKVGDILDLGRLGIAMVASAHIDPSDKKEVAVLVSTSESFGWRIDYDDKECNYPILKEVKPKNGEFMTGWYFYSDELLEMATLLPESSFDRYFERIEDEQGEIVAMDFHEVIDTVRSIDKLFGTINEKLNLLMDCGYDVDLQAIGDVVRITVGMDNQEYSIYSEIKID